MDSKFGILVLGNPRNPWYAILSSDLTPHAILPCIIGKIIHGDKLYDRDNNIWWLPQKNLIYLDDFFKFLRNLGFKFMVLCIFEDYMD